MSLLEPGYQIPTYWPQNFWQTDFQYWPHAFGAELAEEQLLESPGYLAEQIDSRGNLDEQLESEGFLEQLIESPLNEER